MFIVRKTPQHITNGLLRLIHHCVAKRKYFHRWETKVITCRDWILLTVIVKGEWPRAEIMRA